MLPFPIAHLSGAFPPPDIYNLPFGTTVTTAAQMATAGFTFARTSSAWDDSLVSYAAGVPVVTAARGLYVEEARTNTFLHTAVPATQAIAGLSGTCVCWMTGAGSIALTGGATGTASEGSPLVFSPSGSVTFTVTAPVDFASVEQAGFPTLPIVTVGTAVTRNAATLISAAPAWALTAGTVLVKARSPLGVSSQNVAWCIDDGSTSNRIKLDRNSSKGLRLVVTAGGVDLVSSYTGNNTLADDTGFAAVLTWQAGAYSLLSTVGNLSAGVATVPPGMDNERIGLGQGGSLWNGPINRVARWSTVLTAAQATAALAGA